MPHAARRSVIDDVEYAWHGQADFLVLPLGFRVLLAGQSCITDEFREMKLQR
jgi:hypothetical protein